METLYKEKNLQLTEDAIVISMYYFPMGTTKIIKWSDIKGIRQEPLTFMNGKLRAWGMNMKAYWFNSDWRAGKDQMFVIDTGHFIKSAITPDNFEAVKKVFLEKGVLRA